jgi:hypothetical protein
LFHRLLDQSVASGTREIADDTKGQEGSNPAGHRIDWQISSDRSAKGDDRKRSQSQHRGIRPFHSNPPRWQEAVSIQLADSLAYTIYRPAPWSKFNPFSLGGTT